LRRSVSNQLARARDNGAPAPYIAAMTATAPLEKTPLERYVTPAKPSLVGLSRAELAEKLVLVGVPERA
jgi:hypothetical protein